MMSQIGEAVVWLKLCPLIDSAIAEEVSDHLLTVKLYFQSRDGR